MTVPSVDRTTRRDDTLVGVFAIGLALVWSVVAVYSIHPALPYNPLRLPYSNVVKMVTYVPQGWSFFTRDPREEQMTMYARRDGAWVDAVLGPHGKLSNVFGLRRKSRAQGVETALLLNRAQDPPSIRCTVSLEECLATLPAGLPITNTSPAPTLCGTVAVVMRPPIPWAWAASPRAIHMPARIFPLQVEC